MKRQSLISLALSLGAGYGLYRLLRPPAPVVAPSPAPAADYAAALRKTQALQARDNERITPVCRTRLLTHGRKTPRSLILIHGFTNCPQQFVELAEQFFAAGYNVLIPRVPGHGAARMASDLKDLTAEQAVETVSRSIDIARGLGDAVTVLGFSMGGVIAGWAAQNRSDVERVILVSPGFGVMPIRPPLTTLYANLFRLLPNFFQWWDPVAKDARIGVPHAYPRFPSHGLAALLRLSLIVQRQARHAPPAVGDLLVITNPHDDTVRNSVTEALVAAWRKQGAGVTTYAFPAVWQLPHDLMDPQQPAQQTDRVYPLLVELVG
ncbi:MAG: alpha/beta fold hydrolase [Caldilineaceae bacterium]|nr:alpha/beta fold hydrolase [Caldilineaceae bacterium]